MQKDNRVDWMDEAVQDMTEQGSETGTELDSGMEAEPDSGLDMLNPEEWEQAISMYGDMVYRVLRLHVKDKADADDLYQETFIRLMRNRKPFTNEEHRKAWLLRVTLNLCKDFHNSYWQRRMVSLSNSGDLYSEDETDVGVLQAVMKLPEKMRLAVHLHYYEGYSVPEMAQLLKRKENSIYSDLSRARIKLKKWLGG